MEDALKNLEKQKKISNAMSDNDAQIRTLTGDLLSDYLLIDGVQLLVFMKQRQQTINPSIWDLLTFGTGRMY
jgi:hypothetical protein